MCFLSFSLINYKKYLKVSVSLIARYTQITTSPWDEFLSAELCFLYRNSNKFRSEMFAKVYSIPSKVMLIQWFSYMYMYDTGPCNLQFLQNTYPYHEQILHTHMKHHRNPWLITLRTSLHHPWGSFKHQLGRMIIIKDDLIVNSLKT